MASILIIVYMEIQMTHGGFMAIADFFYSFINHHTTETQLNSKSLWSSNKYLSFEKAKKLAKRYSNKGNVWIAQKLRNHNCSEEFIGRAVGSIATERERAELMAANKWYNLSHADNRVKIIKLAKYLMERHFDAETSWTIAREFGNVR